MPTAAWPSVVTAVMSTASTALPAVRVVRGFDVSQDPSDVVMVGLGSIEELEWANAGSFQQSMQTFGGNREELGTVNGLVLAWNGDGDQGAACDTAFSYLAALETAVRADPTLGLTGFGYVVAEISAGEVAESQNNDGATTSLSFSIAYKIRI